MSEEFIKSIPKAFSESLGRYVSQNRPELLTFLTGEVGAEKASDILDVIDRIHAADVQVQEARNRGINPSHWLGEQLIASDPAILDAEIPGLGSLKGSTASELGNRILKFGGSGLGQALTEADGVPIPLEDDAPQATRDLATAFFTSPFGDPVEREVTAVAAGSAQRLADKLGLPIKTPSMVGAVALGLHTSKTGFKVAKGEITSTGAAERINDRLAAIAVAGAGHLVEKGLTVGGAVVGTFVGSLLGVPPLGTLIGGTLGFIAGNIIRPLVEEGLRVIAKPLFEKITEVVRGPLITLKGWLFG